MFIHQFLHIMMLQITNIFLFAFNEVKVYENPHLNIYFNFMTYPGYR